MVGPQDASDVLQQVFLQTYRNIRQYSGRASFSTWLYRLTINECLQFRRRERRPGRETLIGEPIDRSPSHAMHAQRQELLEQALQKLDPELRAIFLLREVEGLPYSEIATALKIPQGTVGSRLNRAGSNSGNISFSLAGNPRMNCSTAREFLSAFHDRELRPELEAEVREHIGQCVEWRGRLRTSAKYREWPRSFATRARSGECVARVEIRIGPCSTRSADAVAWISSPTSSRH